MTESLNNEHACPLTPKTVDQIFNVMNADNRGVNLAILLMRQERLDPMMKMLQDISYRIKKIEETLDKRLGEYRGELSSLEVTISDLETTIENAFSHQ